MQSTLETNRPTTGELPPEINPQQQASVNKPKQISIAISHLSTGLQQTLSNNRHVQRTTPALTLFCDIAAATLSYSAALFINTNAPERSIASGAAWVLSGLFSGLEHTLLTSKKMLMSKLADASCVGAGIASISSSVLSKQAKPQALINCAAYISNALWITSGGWVHAATARGEYDNSTSPSSKALDLLAKILLYLAGASDMIAGACGIANTIRTNGSSQQLNQLSSNFWMTSSLLNTLATAIQIQVKKLDRREQPLAEIHTLELEEKLQELALQIQNQITLIAEQTSLIQQQQMKMDQQNDEIKTLNRVSHIQDGTIAKLRQENLRKRAHLPKKPHDDNFPPPEPSTSKHNRSLSETTPLLAEYPSE